MDDDFKFLTSIIDAAAQIPSLRDLRITCNHEYEYEEEVHNKIDSILSKTHLFGFSPISHHYRFFIENSSLTLTAKKLLIMKRFF